MTKKKLFTNKELLQKLIKKDYRDSNHQLKDI